MKPDHQIAEKIRRARQGKGWTQEKLAEEAGITSRTVINAEAGKGINLGTLSNIAFAMGYSVLEILSTPNGDQGEMTNA